MGEKHKILGFGPSVLEQLNTKNKISIKTHVPLATATNSLLYSGWGNVDWSLTQEQDTGGFLKKCTEGMIT